MNFCLPDLAHNLYRAESQTVIGYLLYDKEKRIILSFIIL